MSWRSQAGFARTWSGAFGPGMLEAIAGWPNAQWSAASPRGAPWRGHAVLAGGAGVEVVDQQRVARVDAEPLETVLVGADHAVAGVVEAELEGQRVAGDLKRGHADSRPVEDAADLGAERVAVARLG